MWTFMVDDLRAEVLVRIALALLVGLILGLQAGESAAHAPRGDATDRTAARRADHPLAILSVCRRV